MAIRLLCKIVSVSRRGNARFCLEFIDELLSVVETDMTADFIDGQRGFQQKFLAFCNAVIVEVLQNRYPRMRVEKSLKVSFRDTCVGGNFFHRERSVEIVFDKRLCSPYIIDARTDFRVGEAFVQLYKQLNEPRLQVAFVGESGVFSLCARKVDVAHEIMFHVSPSNAMMYPGEE